MNLPALQFCYGLTGELRGFKCCPVGTLNMSLEVKLSRRRNKPLSGVILWLEIRSPVDSSATERPQSTDPSKPKTMGIFKVN